MGLQQRDCSGFSPDSHLILAAGQRFGTKQCKSNDFYKRKTESDKNKAPQKQNILKYYNGGAQYPVATKITNCSKSC